MSRECYSSPLYLTAESRLCFTYFYRFLGGSHDRRVIRSSGVCGVWCFVWCVCVCVNKKRFVHLLSDLLKIEKEMQIKNEIIIKYTTENTIRIICFRATRASQASINHRSIIHTPSPQPTHHSHSDQTLPHILPHSLTSQYNKQHGTAKNHGRQRV